MAQKRELIPVTVYLSPETVDELRRQAAAGHISVSAVVRRALVMARVQGQDQPLRR